ncbi:hypothetical protein MHH52_26805 [Paenibacillus sp. FSL K6-0276]|uniref:hypothetical protein n=1 Tax=Paenibacillus sp. FSL K6-0276 TaxID=2921450 RepID=UPI0030EB2362
MGEVEEYRSLIQQRREVLLELIQCSESQLLMLSGEVDDDMASLFDQSIQTWNQYTEDMDRVQNLLSSSAQSDNSDDSKELITLVQKLASNVEQSKSLLEQSAGHVGTDLKHARSQRKLMNAYYHMENTDQIPLYFDQKK